MSQHYKTASTSEVDDPYFPADFYTLQTGEWRPAPPPFEVLLGGLIAWMWHYLGWGVSVLLHAAAAFILGYVAYFPSLGNDSVRLETRFGAAEAEADLTRTASLFDNRVGGAPLDLTAVPQELGSTSQAPSQKVNWTHAAQLTGLGRSEVGTVQGRGTGVGKEIGSGTGGKVEFFGTKGLGDSAVFVVDMSGSMEEDGRFARAQQELIQAIKSLHARQKFYVVFYSQHELPLFVSQNPAKGNTNPPNKLMTATPSLKEKSERWIRSIRPWGSTEPREALERALKLRPDMIYFLTDGEIPLETREILRKNNRYRVTIHTIAFQSKDGQEILRQIAEDHHGSYRFIP